MSRRTFPRFTAAALLIATLAVPIPAQPPRTHSVSEPGRLAPMPREKAPPFGSAFGPIALDLDFTFPATPQANDTQVFNFFVGLLDSGPVAVAPMPREKGREVTIYGSCLACEQLQPPACCAAATTVAARPAGTFYREIPGAVVAITFRGDEMRATLTSNDNGAVATFTLTADCAITKDGTVHGVVTGVDVEAKGDDAKDMDLAAISFEMQGLMDQPFAFRTKTLDGGLMVSNLRVACGRDNASECVPEMGLLVGRYKPACHLGVPSPKAVKAGPMFQRNVYAPEPDVRMQQTFTLPCPTAASPCPVPASNADRAEERYATPIGARTAVLPPAVFPAPHPMPCPAQCPVPGDVSDMMIRVFGEMLGGCRHAPPVVSGMTLPSPRYLQHYPQYFPPDPTFPLPREIQMMECRPAPCPMPVPVPQVIGVTMSAMPSPYGVPPPPPPTCGAPVRVVVQPAPWTTAPVLPSVRKLPIGTWSREVGPIMYTLSIQGDHLTLTATMSDQSGDETVITRLSLTADYYITRDGSGMVGLITGADVNTTLGRDGSAMLKMLTQVQKAVTDKPFALSYRMYGETLVIGNLRLPPAEDEEIVAVLGAAAGQYKLAANGVPPAPSLKRAGNAQAIPAGARITPETVWRGQGQRVELDDPGVLANNPVLLPPALPGSPGAGSVPPMPVPEPVDPEALRSSKQACPVVGAVLGPIGACCPSGVGRCAESPKKLSIADVVELTKAGLADCVICRQIRLTRSTFNLSVADLRHLKSNGVADCVILEMQDTVESDRPLPRVPSSGRSSCLPDPNVRMRQLLDQSEVSGPIRREWRRLWLIDQPGRTVERIHGGII